VQNILSSTLLSKNIKIQVYRTIILPFVLCGSETWSPTLREIHRLRMYKTRVLRIFWSRREEVMGEWRKLQYEELNDLYCSPNIIQAIKSRRLKSAGHVACMGERRGTWGNLRGKATWKTQA
jgi:hypothetical protein